MDWLYALGGILGIVGLAFFFGWAGKNVKSPVVWVTIAIGLFLLFLWLNGWIGNAFLLVMAALDALDHIPRWIGLMVAAVIVGYYIRFIISAFAQGIDNIALEQQKINARIALLENSIIAKLDDISSQLPPRDEPEYLKELRKEALRD
jgi:uncharacterized membrane protein YgaE (UPF0421/DUF939 family)